MTYNPRRRDGLFSIRTTAQRLCRFIIKFQFIIAALYPASPAVGAALAAVLAACEVLIKEIDTLQHPPS